MSVQLALRVSMYLLVVDGLTALALAGLIEPSWWPFVGLMVATSWWSEAIRSRIAGAVRRPRLLTLLAVSFFALDLLYLAGSLLDGFVHLLVFVLLYKLFAGRALRDSRDILLLSLFMLVAASALTVSIGFLFLLLVFLLLWTWAFVLYHLMSESERSAPGHGLTLIESRDLVTPSLLGLCLVSSAAIALFTLAFFLTIPRLGQAALPMQARMGQMVTGFSDQVELGSFGTLQTDETVVMRVHFPDGPASPDTLEGIRWRGIALDHFSGREWSLTRPQRRAARRGVGGYIPLAHPSRSGRVVTQEIYLEPIGTEVLFAAPRLLGMVVSTGSVWVDVQGSVSSPIPAARLRYRALSELETLSPGTTTVAALSDEERARHLQLPPLVPRIGALGREVSGASPDPWTAAVRLTRYFRTGYRYTLELEPADGLEPLENFLFHGRAGNCEYFATGLAVLLRTLGIPARVVNGFQRGVWNPYGRYFTVRQLDAHSWVEAYFPDRGWVTLDPSPRAGFDASWTPSATFQYLDALQMRWHRYVINWSLGDQLRASLFVRQRGVAWRRALFSSRPSLAVGARGAAIAAVVASALTLAIFLWRRGGALVPGRLGSRVSVPAYVRMLKRLARLGLAPGPGETAREFCGRVGLEFPHLRDPVEEVTRVYEDVRFGAVALVPEEAARLRGLVDRLKVPRPAV